MLHLRTPFAAAALVCGLLLSVCVVHAQTPPVVSPAAVDVDPDTKLFDKAVTKGLEYLTTSQAVDGSYSKQHGPGVTALAIAALLAHGRPASDPLVVKGLTYLETFVQPDGGIYLPTGVQKNYETCAAVLAFSAANGPADSEGKYTDLLLRASQFVQKLQWDDEEGHDKSSPAYGGAGWGLKKRADLPNTRFLAEALKAAGVAPRSEALQKAAVFASRCQNLDSPHNDTPHAGKIGDGGFYFTPLVDGENPAGKSDNGGLRSYGSMTYAGLEILLLANVKRHDPRVKAALAWTHKHHDLKVNPGQGTAGLYCYYQTLARTLDLLGVEVFKDDADQPHYWRSELLQELGARQFANGAWVNPDVRWMEGDPNLTTSYALLALSAVNKPVTWKVKPPPPVPVAVVVPVKPLPVKGNRVPPVKRVPEPKNPLPKTP